MNRELKGYKSASGNYITVADQKRNIAKTKKMDAEVKKERELEEIRKQELDIAKYIQEKNEIKKAIEENESHAIQCKNFIKYCGEFFKNYNQYLIGWDIANSNRYQIEADLYNNKITIEQIKEVYNKSKAMITNIDNYIYLNDLIRI